MAKIYVILDRFLEQAHWWLIGVFVLLGAKIMKMIGNLAAYFGKSLANSMGEDIQNILQNKLVSRMQSFFDSIDLKLTSLEKKFNNLEKDIKKIERDVKNKIDSKHKVEGTLAEIKEAVINFDEDRERFDLVRETLLKEKDKK